MQFPGKGVAVGTMLFFFGFVLSPAVSADPVQSPHTHNHIGAGKLYGGVADDGGGYRMKKGKMHKVPPRVDKSAQDTQLTPAANAPKAAAPVNATVAQ